MIDDGKLIEMEEAGATEDSPLAFHVCELVSEVRRLKHELADPNYLYAGRIHRQAILSRNATIDQLLREVKRLKVRLAAWEHGT